MSVSVEKLDGNMAKLTIEVDAAEFEKYIDKAFNRQKKNISIPGFRKGKASRAMVEKMYGKGVFLEDAANLCMPEAYEKAYEECGEEITSSPEVDVTQIEPGKSFIFTATVALKPAVKLGKYKGVEVPKADLTVSDDDVLAEIKKEQDSNARTISVEDRAVQDGDITTIDFEGFVDGVAFEGGKGENYPLTIGSGAFIPGFEEQLIGAELEKEVEVNVTFPEDYHSEDLKGKAAVFKCTVHEIKTKELPELDDEFASEVSDFDTLDEYKADVKKSLEEKKAAQAKSAKEEAAIDAVIADADMDIPEAMVATRQKEMLNNFAQRMQMQGLKMDDYYKYTGATEAMMMEQVKPEAEKAIKARLVLEQVAVDEKIEATEEDYEAKMKEMAEIYGMEVDKVKEMLGDNDKAIEQIKEDIKVEKAREFIVENAKEA